MTDKPLNPRNLLFLDELYADPKRNASAAYRRVYGAKSDRSAGVAANRLMRDPRIAAELARREADLRERAAITAEEVLLEITRLAKADPRDLVEYRRGACRFCHGAGHMYHRTPQEYREAFATYQAKQGAKDPAGLHFDHQGGVGFNPNRAAHPDCPECFGHGEGYEYVRDTRTLTPGAARLYAGVKRTKDGLQVLTRSQDKMVELAAKHLGLLRDKPEDHEGDLPPAATVTYEGADARK